MIVDMTIIWDNKNINRIIQGISNDDNNRTKIPDERGVSAGESVFAE